MGTYDDLVRRMRQADEAHEAARKEGMLRVLEGDTVLRGEVTLDETLEVMTRVGTGDRARSSVICLDRTWAIALRDWLIWLELGEGDGAGVGDGH